VLFFIPTSCLLSSPALKVCSTLKMRSSAQTTKYNYLCVPVQLLTLQPLPWSPTPLSSAQSSASASASLPLANVLVASTCSGPVATSTGLQASLLKDSEHHAMPGFAMFSMVTQTPRLSLLILLRLVYRSMVAVRMRCVMEVYMTGLVIDRAYEGACIWCYTNLSLGDTSTMLLRT
jgi:hypothetical protein